MNEMFLVFGRSLCEGCADADLSQRGSDKIPEGSVRRQTDDTICSGCGRDNGSSPFPKLGGGLPVCMECESKFKNWPYPGWIKVGFAALLFLAVLSCIYNWRFFEALREIRQAHRSAEAGELAAASSLADSASRRVPESGDVATLASFLRGLHLLSQDKATEALPHLQRAADSMPGDAGIQDLKLRAEMGAAYERKDYDQFLSRSKTAMERHPEDPMTVAGVASAYACKWAVTGDGAFRQEALKYLDQARKLPGTQQADFKEYEGRILFRLDSREIINREEHRRRFPNGYVHEGVAR